MLVTVINSVSDSCFF